MDSRSTYAGVPERTDRRSAPSFTWGAPFVSGALVALIGFLAFWFPVVSGVVSAVFIGLTLGAAGIVEIIGALRHRRDRSAVLPTLSGILSIVVGVLFVTQPLLGVAALGLLLAAYFFATGLFRGIVSLADRYERWGWDFAYGVIAIAAGVILLLDWPVTSLLIVGFLVGIELLFRGIALMAIAWRIRLGLGSPRNERGGAPASV